MRTRTVTLASGDVFAVPQGIQRLDSKSTHGWQVRYQGTKYFADGPVGPKKALELATKELLRRISTLPAPVGLRREPSPGKTSALPAGISGPIVVNSRGSKVPSAVLSISVPRYNQPNQTKKVHIGTPNTYTRARFRAALATAVEIRAEGLAQYEEAATKDRRRIANSFKKALRSSAVAG